MQKDERRTENRSRRSKSIIVAAIILMLCLITTCVVGTTLAKYTTSGDGSDSARVAKWGVNIEINGDSLFKNEYQKSDSDATLTVKSSSTEDKVVAPGTSGSTTFSITGTPEVALNVTIKLENIEDVFLKANDENNFDADYYPIVFTLKQTANRNGNIDHTIATGTLADIAKALNGTSDSWSENYAPNTKLDSTFELSWEWAFDGGNDAADTILGDYIAANKSDCDDYCLNVSYELTVTATQID